MNASAPYLPRAGRFHTRLALCALLALTLIVPAAIQPAAAHASSPLDFSAGDQYVETLPTSKGPKVTENAPKRRAGSGLSKQVRKQLQDGGGSDAGTLAFVADSPELGAPVTTGSSSGGSGDGNGNGSKQPSKKSGGSKESPNVPSATVTAAADSGNDMLWLALGLPLITAIALGAFGIQRRNRDAS